MPEVKIISAGSSGEVCSGANARRAGVEQGGEAARRRVRAVDRDHEVELGQRLLDLGQLGKAARVGDQRLGAGGGEAVADGVRPEQRGERHRDRRQLVDRKVGHHRLSPVAAAFPSRAGFSFSLYTFEPAWGFRAAAAKYYSLYPRFFEKRVQRDGGWVCWGNCADVEKLDELGYAYHWGLSGPEACKFDNDHGIYALPYIEATNMHQTMEGATATAQ